MFEYTERLKLPLLIPNQSGKEITHNEALIIIDNLLQNHVISKQNTPPTDFKTGDIYIVAENATEDWLSKENQLAIFDNGWRFLEPIEGMLFYVLSENCFYVYKDNWIKLETLIDFTKLQNTTIDNLQKDEVIKYNGTTFINTREINLLKLYINDKLLIDEDFNISNNIKISGVNIDEHIINVVNTNAKGFAKADLSNLTEEGQNSIKNVVNENVLNRDVNNITQIGIKNIQNYCLPDYSAGIEIPLQQGVEKIYTAPENGVITIDVAGFNNGYCYLYINDNLIFKSTSNTNTYYNGLSAEYLLSKNDVCKILTSYSLSYASTSKAIFFPLKGINNI